MEKRNKRMILGLFLALIIVFLAGMAGEIVPKLVAAQRMSTPGVDPSFPFRKTVQFFGDETSSLWALPTFVLNLMSISPREPAAFILRWIPYLIVFLLPILSSFIRKRWIPLLACGALATYKAVGILLAVLISKYAYFTYFNLVPFAAEAIVVMLACGALAARKKGFSITMGVICVVLAVVSPAVTAALSGLTSQTLMIRGFDLWVHISRNLRDVFSYASSQWPIFKAFAFLMYALILFIAPIRFRRKENPA